MTELDQHAVDGGAAGDRLARFESDLARVGARRPTPNRDRALAVAGALLVAVGFVVAFVGVNLTRSATTELEQGDGLAQVLLGVGIAVIGSVIWLRFSLGIYLRYWMLRTIHERRA